MAPFSDLNLKVVDATSRRGQCHARNTAAAAASTNYLLFCDADDIVSPAWVAGLFRAVSDDDVLATGPLRVDRLNSSIVWRTYLSAGVEVDQVQPALTRPFVFLGYLPLVIGCSLAIRRTTFDRLGRFDETMTGGSEDADLAWRAQEAGLQICCVDEAIVDYRLRSGVGEIFAQRRRYEHSKVRLWVRSRALGRPVRGMSLKWAAVETLKWGPRWLRLRGAPYGERYVAAFTAGSVVGNLEAQITMRILRRDV